MTDTLTVGADVEVDVEKPAAGGRMIARHEGQILLVSGAIPGERVRVRIDRVEKRLAFAVKLTAAASGSYTINGNFKFAVCDRDQCLAKQETIAIAVAAK